MPENRCGEKPVLGQGQRGGDLLLLLPVEVISRAGGGGAQGEPQRWRRSAGQGDGGWVLWWVRADGLPHCSPWRHDRLRVPKL